MDESVVKHLEQQQVGTLRLSEAIRIGCSFVKEGKLYSGCAIGTGYRVLTGRNLSDDYRSSGVRACVLVSNAFSVPERIVTEVSGRHYMGDWSREQCADWLESQGY